MSDPTEFEVLPGEEDLPDENDYQPRQRMTAKSAARLGGRMAAGVIGTAAAVAVLAAATALPLPTLSVEPPSEVITPVATGQQLVCPGAVLRLADETGQGATASAPIGRPTVREAASAGSIDHSVFESSDATGSGGTGSAPALLESPPNPEDPSVPILVAGAQSQVTAQPDFVGLATAACSVANGDTWLVGGSTLVGRTTLLTLSNPTEVPATVDIEIFGENGPVAAPGTNGIVVSPNGQRVLSVAGFVPDLGSPVIHVVSRGGRIVANLQQSIVRGLDPGGVDIVGATVQPSTSLRMPGLVMTDSHALEPLITGEGPDDILTAVRLFVPGEENGTATVNYVPEDGSGNGISFAVDLTAGRVGEFPIAEFPEGSFTVTVDADVPVVGAARVSSAGSSGTDFAWLAASPRLDDEVMLVVAEGGEATAHFANPTAIDAEVVLTGNGTADVTVTVPAGSSATAAVEPGASYLATGFETMHISVTVTDNGFIGSYAVQPPGAVSTPIRVYP